MITINAMNINYAELYGVKPNETDFSGAIKRSLKNGVVHIGDKIYKRKYTKKRK